MNTKHILKQTNEELKLLPETEWLFVIGSPKFDVEIKKFFIQNYVGKMDELLDQVISIGNRKCLSELIECLYDTHWEVLTETNLMTIAEHSATPVPVLDKIFNCNPPLTVLNRLMGNSNASPEALSNVNTWSQTILRKLASHKNTPPDILTNLFNEQNEPIRRTIAMNSSISESLMEQIVEENEPSVLIFLVQNPNITTHVLTKLLDNDIFFSVRNKAGKALFEQNFFGDWPEDWVEGHYGIKL